jgi:cobalt-zinc-cadmium efflux system membrane fusion protein
MLQQLANVRPARWLVLASCLGAAALAVVVAVSWFAKPALVGAGTSDMSSQSRRIGSRYIPTASEWASLTIEPVGALEFRAEHVTEGKVAVNEDQSTSVFSPYAGRITRLLARPGDMVAHGQALFAIEAADTVAAQNDFVAAATALNKAKSQLDLASLQEKRSRDLLEGKATPLKDYQQAQATLITAQNDLRSATTALEAARNRLRILGLDEEAIASFQDKGRINPESTIYAPIGGTVVQRKAGPGQFIAAGAADPIYVIGDLSSVWLVAYVRESEASQIEVGDLLHFTVLAMPGREFNAKIDYIATAIDPQTRRLMVRAAIDNTARLLKPEMFASVTIYSSNDRPAAAVPRQALIYEGDQVRVWVVRDDHSIELRQLKTGLINGNLVEVLSGLEPGERIVTKGSLFIDRSASAS